MEQISLELARARGAEGMQAAAAGAEAKAPGITDAMFTFLVRYAQRARAADRFTAEDVTDAYAIDTNLVQPKDQRAWGSVFTRAVRQGVIAIADNKGVRRKGHGSRGSFRYRSIVNGKPWSWVMVHIDGSVEHIAP